MLMPKNKDKTVLLTSCLSIAMQQVFPASAVVGDKYTLNHTTSKTAIAVEVLSLYSPELKYNTLLFFGGHLYLHVSFDVGRRRHLVDMFIATSI